MPQDTQDTLATAYEAALAKMGDAPQGQIKRSLLDRQLHNLAIAWGNEATRPGAEALLKAWDEGTEPLRKGIAQAWLDRARGTISGTPTNVVQIDDVHPSLKRMRDLHKKASVRKLYDDVAELGALAKDYEEDKHPRGDGGKWTAGSGGAALAGGGVAAAGALAYAHHTGLLSGAPKPSGDNHVKIDPSVGPNDLASKIDEHQTLSNGLHQEAERQKKTHSSSAVAETTARAEAHGAAADTYRGMLSRAKNEAGHIEPSAIGPDVIQAVHDHAKALTGDWKYARNAAAGVKSFAANAAHYSFDHHTDMSNVVRAALKFAGHIR